MNTIHTNNFNDYDRFALYLRPLDASGSLLYVAGASESQANWGGLHATLCSFRS